VLHGGEELAHQHVETAVAAERDDLARTVERLDAVGLAERGPDRAIVEGADDPLLAALADPVARPERVEPVSMTNTASRAARSLTARATACG
jgi:hypothetical protein